MVKSAALPSSLIAVCLLGIGGARAAPPPDEQWIPTFREDFDGAGVDAAAWISGTPRPLPATVAPALPAATAAFSTGASEPARMVLSDGALHLVLRHRSGHGVAWRGASLFTRHFRQSFGYFEARLRYARSTGLANIFRLSTGGPRGAGSMEIAVDEGTYPAHVGLAVRRNGRLEQADKVSIPDQDLSADYHVFGLAWLPDGRGGATLTWYVDGQAVHTTPCRYCTRPLGVWLGTEVRTWDGPFAPVPDGAAMDVDYVRVYQLRRLADVQSVHVPTPAQRSRGKAQTPVANVEPPEDP